MMKKLIIIGLLTIIVIAQTTVQPKTQGCACNNLLSQSDCIAQNGCVWTFQNTTNSTTNSTTISITDGSCAISNITIKPTPTYSTYCSVMTSCASTLGCAYLNGICTIFTGCSAYVQTTNQACQQISTQCTTDGTRCISPTSCNNYLTENLCRGNLATSGAMSCNWNNGKCEDKVCSDAPASYNTLLQCQNWINGCLTSGKGCALTLNPCSSYNRADGCQGMIGSDGPCVENTSDGSKVCRKAECSDAPITLSTNAACSQYLSGCLSNGKGCAQILSACNTYDQTQQCSTFIGSDGPCTVDTTDGSTKCRALKCTDASTSLNTNSACSQFLSGCVTNGYGCDDSLKQCSSYQGTSTTCSLRIGNDGKCKGSSDATSSCQKRLCSDAPSSTKTDQACNLFQAGCITNGAGCTDTLGLCSSYKGTFTTCTQYIGNDGNCTAPANQAEQGDCRVRGCTDAPKTLTTNSDCQNYSKACITNGGGCIELIECSLISQLTQCQGNPACSPNQTCLDRSRCGNYKNQSQCTSNKQFYQSGGNIYLRPCIWHSDSNSCSDTYCLGLPNTLTTDQACNDALPGCLTKGQGCIDISEPCTNYQGLLACSSFKGLNGTQKCGQLSSETDDTKRCVIKTSCSQAKDLSVVSITQDSNCNSFLSSCYFDGKDNCTNGDCASYFGTQTFCGNIKTAISGGKPQDCWKVANTSDATSACVPKQCSQAPTSSNTNTLCDTFMKGCLWNGTNAGGCQDPSTECSTYQGTLSQCETFYESGKQCSKGFVSCAAAQCSDNQIPVSAQTDLDKGLFCQKFKNMSGQNCKYQSGSTCSNSVNINNSACQSFVADGANDLEKQQYCQSLSYPGGPGCGYIFQDNCSPGSCYDFKAVGDDDHAKGLYCKSIIINSFKGACQYNGQGEMNCTLAATCSDILLDTKEACLAFSNTCFWNHNAKLCRSSQQSCGNYYLPLAYTTPISKMVIYCAGQASQNSSACYHSSSNGWDPCTDLLTSCSSIGIPSDVTDKAGFCKLLYVQTGDTVSPCAYSEATPGYCANQTTCINYNVPSGGEQNFCSQLKGSDGYVCSFTASESTCNSPQADCSDYNTYGDTVIANQNFCKLYYATNGGFCGANTSGPTKCKSLECNEYTYDDQCSSYNSSCIYNGSGCVIKQNACSDYGIPNTVSGQQSCFSVTSTTQSQCGWDVGTTCSQRACSQLKSGLSAANCKSFVDCSSDPTKCCQYDGQSCLAKDICSKYIPHGSNDAENAQICNNMKSSGGGNCTYQAGQTNCGDALANCNYEIPASAKTNELAFKFCSLMIDAVGASCGYTAGSQVCSLRNCAQALFATGDSDCNAYLSNCKADTANNRCNLKQCTSAISTLKTDQACQSYRSGCVTTGNGCVESTDPCSTYKGTQITCNGFIGNSIPCSNSITAISTDSCINKTCDLNTTALKDSDCDTWYPPTGPVKNCVWNGTAGCAEPRQCSQFTGTNDICQNVTATDGPCYRLEQSSGACAATNTGCQNAPSIFNTDVLCKSWGSQCITNGTGCIAKASANCGILPQQVCSLYKTTSGLYCDLADSCMSKPTKCNEYKNASDCNNIPLIGQDKITCGWNSQSSTCDLLTCDQLPVTLTTDAGCSNIFSTCVTNGAGCVTKGPCTSYSRLNCGTAVTTDTQKTCIWSNSGCRPIQCQDNLIASSDSACNSYLLGCKSTGLGCAQSLTCPIIKIQQLCLTDSQGLPCLWYKPPGDQVGYCISYQQCSDLIQSTHSACQAASTQCTTNGINCISITSCTNTVLQASCIKGTDGNCGWLPAFQDKKEQCSLFTQCVDAKGTFLQQCQFWGQNCVSDGTQCIQKSTCSAYLTQMTCSSNGTDGQCFWVAQNGSTNAFCRLQQCSDATTNNLTHLGCSQFLAQTACTTSGQGCIQQGLCSSYNISEGCVQGTDGVCFWEQQNNQPTTISTQLCRLKQCTDVILTTSASCSNAINGVKCVSNGVNCIQKQQCSSYINREACLGGGLDGSCAFKPSNVSNSTNSTNSTDIGTCELFKSCQNADQDQVACNSRFDACLFNSTTINGTTTTSCQAHTCSSKQQGTQCLAVPSFDLQSYKICVLQGTTCVEGNVNQLTAQTCYQGSIATYTWNTATQTCQACIQNNIQINNTDNNTGNNTNGHLLETFILIVFIMI